MITAFGKRKTGNKKKFEGGLKKSFQKFDFLRNTHKN